MQTGELEKRKNWRSQQIQLSFCTLNEMKFPSLISHRYLYLYYSNFSCSQVALDSEFLIGMSVDRNGNSFRLAQW